MPIAAKCLIRTLILTALVLVVLVVRAVQDLANPKLTNRLAFAAAGATPRWFMPIAAGDLIKTLIVLAALVLAVQDLVLPKLTNRLVFAVAGARPGRLMPIAAGGLKNRTLIVQILTTLILVVCCLHKVLLN